MMFIKLLFQNVYSIIYLYIYPDYSWIEGIESEQKLMRPFYPILTCMGCHLRVQCVHQGDKILYREDMNSPCSCENGQLV